MLGYPNAGFIAEPCGLLGFPAGHEMKKDVLGLLRVEKRNLINPRAELKKSCYCVLTFENWPCHTENRGLFH